LNGKNSPGRNKKLLPSVFSWVRKININSRLLIAFLFLSILPITIVGIESSTSSYRDMEEKSVQYCKSISYQVVKNIGRDFDSYSGFETYLNEFEKIAANSETGYQIFNYNKLKELEQIEVASTLRFQLASIVSTTRGINSFEIRTLTGERFYCGTPITSHDINKSPLINLTNANEDMVWTCEKKEVGNDERSYIMIARTLKDNTEGRLSGYAIMAIDKKYLDDLCTKNASDIEMSIVITDINGQIITHTEKELELTMIDANIKSRIDQIEASDTSQDNFFKTQLSKKDVLVTYDTLKGNGWRVITIIPYSYMMQSTMNNVRITILIVALAMFFSIFVAYIVTHSIKTPMQNLMHAMDNIGQGDFNQQLLLDEPSSQDEITALTKNFNNMALQLQKLVGDVHNAEINKKELEFLKKEAELNALQQQINPHFLYNILETISCLAEEKGNEEIAEMVTVLSEYFSKSISEGKEVITVSSEIENTKNYVYLQKIRFGARLKVVWEIDEHIMDRKIIKLVLQPIIENAIVHGIASKEEGGMVIVKGYEKDDFLLFEILDNGIGMTPHTIKQLKDSVVNPSKEPNKNIGIRNVQRRIQLYYGTEYGLNIFSKESLGTRVVLTLPNIDNY